ncbi:MAG: hypothetical protein U1C96_07830 [Gallionella sp.]|nr:hypothetical protein [Gallionella sp.]
MTFEIAALLGMGAVLIFGLVALLWASIASDDKKSGHPTTPRLS